MIRLPGDFLDERQDRRSASEPLNSCRYAIMGCDTEISAGGIRTLYKPEVVAFLHSAMPCIP